MKPPQDDLFSLLDESLVDVKEGDVILITSKIVSIHEGRCKKIGEGDIQKIREEGAQLVIPRNYWKSPLTAINNNFVSSSGIDTSNGDGHIIQLPIDPFASAEKIYQYFAKRFGLKNLGIIITDSRSQLLRYGATGCAIAWWGIDPLVSHRGKEDLFGKTMNVARSNLVDGLAAGAVVVMGEVAEAQPIVIAKDIPNLSFTDKNTKDKLFTEFEDDTFRVLYEKWL